MAGWGGYSGPTTERPSGQRVSILQPWVEELGLRYQGTLLAAVRGCDGVPKEDPSKYVVRAIRQAILVPFDARELVLVPDGYMSVSADRWAEGSRKFVAGLDHYPLHFATHVAHAAEVIGYFGPDEWCGRFLNLYQDMCRAMHLRPETWEQLAARMEEDRVGPMLAADPDLRRLLDGCRVDATEGSV